MLVGLHGGKIFVKDSQPEKGTTFRIQMETPVDLLSVPRANLAAKTEMDTRVIPLGTVLLVDDTKTNIIVLKALVKRIDPKAKILVAENGQIGVAMALENDIHFILMDVHMPVLDGIEATKYILASKPDVAVIGLTANTDAEVEVLCRQIGMKEVLLKPTTRPILARTLAWAMADENE
jgi:CheY-like chemotaxis protein